MSLKTFHLVFITISCLMGMGLGVWGMKHHMEIPNTNHLILSIGGFVLAGALIAYELWFLGRKGPLSVSDPEGPRTS